MSFTQLLLTSLGSALIHALAGFLKTKLRAPVNAVVLQLVPKPSVVAAVAEVAPEVTHVAAHTLGPDLPAVHN